MKYLIPFVYGFSTRAKKIFYKFSFFAVIFFPALIVTLFANHDFAYVIPRFLIGPRLTFVSGNHYYDGSDVKAIP